MAANEERPPTTDEIAILRQHLGHFIEENGEDWLNHQDLNRFLEEDDYVGRFFKHCTTVPGDHLKNTEAMIHRTFKWRKANKVDEIVQLDPSLKAKGTLYLRNRDADGKQLLVFDCKKHFKSEVKIEDMQKMLIYFLERVDREDEDGGMVTIVYDCSGSGLKNLDMEYIRYMIDILRDYYPWKFKYILVLNMPCVLSAAWKIIKSLLPTAAVKKIKFIDQTSVQEYIKPDQTLAEWGGTDTWKYEFVEEKVRADGDAEVAIN